MLPFSDLKAQYQRLKPAIHARIDQVLEHGQYILGPEVEELEQRLAGYVSADHCIGVSSGSDGLLIALLALGVGHDDEVIVPTFSFVATCEMVALIGARPVFVDVDPESYTLDFAKLEAAITPKTRAIIPVSLFGQCADFDRINEIAASNHLAVIEDAAQSFGATYHGRRSCGLSTIGCTSFFPSKPLGCYGDGGALFTQDPDLARAMREIRGHGQEKRYFHTRVGINGRLDTLQAAILLAKLESFDWEVAQRCRLGERYTRLIRESSPGSQKEGDFSVVTPIIRPECSSVYAQYSIRVKQRDNVIRHLTAAGIPTAIHYPVPLHRQPAYAGARAPGTFPVAESLANTVMSLPMHPDLTDEDQDRIVSVLTEAIHSGEVK